MSTRAVTPDASAAFEEREPASVFLPTDKEYRKTGNLPDADKPQVAATQLVDKDEHVPAGLKEEEQQQEQAEGDGSAPSTEIEAAPEAAPQQRRPKTAQTSESRWAKLSRENRTLREQLERLQQPPVAPQRETQQASQPAVAAENTEPQIDDVDASGNPKYKTVKEYLAAYGKWVREDAVRAADARFQEAQKTAQQQQFEQVIQQTVAQRVDATRKAHPDYDEVMASAINLKDENGQDVLFYEKGSHLDAFFLDHDRGHEILYTIAKNPDQYAHIFARDQQGRYFLNPIRQVTELAAIGASLGNGSRPVSARPVTQAPPPVRQVSGKGAVAPDATKAALDEGDFESYRRAENARALAARKRK